MEHETSVGRLIGILHRHARMHFAEAVAPHGIAEAQFPFLIRLYRGDAVSQDDLATFLVVDKATAARAVARLEEQGYVTRTPDAHDRRINRVHLTDKARKVEPALRAILRDWSDALTEGFTDDERSTIMALLERMAANAQRRVADSRR